MITVMPRTVYKNILQHFSHSIGIALHGNILTEGTASPLWLREDNATTSRIFHFMFILNIMVKSCLSIKERNTWNTSITDQSSWLRHHFLWYKTPGADLWLMVSYIKMLPLNCMQYWLEDLIAQAFAIHMKQQQKYPGIHIIKSI